jgi:CubicO group peptidase (beta-lactamase class C family)
MEDYASVDVDAILQSILGRAVEGFGMSAAVLRGDTIIAQGVAGVRKRGTVEGIALDDRFQLGSCTKAMTATLVAMFVEEGKLNWSTTLGELFGDRVKPMHPAWVKVTLRQVLAHRAGLGLEPDGVGLFNEMAPPPGTLPQQRLEIVRQALSCPPGIPPDTKYWYSNVGYILAGAALEQLTGRAWEELMRERLFQPLGISTGGFGAPPNTIGTDKTKQAWGHSQLLGKPLDPRSPAAEIPLFNGPAGLAHMTVTDWAKFIALHLRGDPANPHGEAALLKLDTFAELQPVAPTTPYSNGWVMRGITRLVTGDAAPAVTYRAGWFISTAGWARGAGPGDTGRRLWHAGSNGRWTCAVVMAPEIDFAVLVACNRGWHSIAAWKTRQALKALIRTFAPKRTA